MKKKTGKIFFYLDFICLIISIGLVFASLIYFNSWAYPIIFIMFTLRMFYNVLDYVKSKPEK
ncbi:MULTISPECIES: hypothetical protein [unclassified Bacillus (in: firmicutes)]|uniref:hypothetical protein n=1 Tax=unclassified Bacillus (in: firmicutes) TaxID=185979 RepID=UPI0008E803C2|nr:MULTISPECIES: hypothetical protein [unclassified Bacillus (in: firmicutes)]SFI33420.1 hypothetical protein SAMN04488574_102372 [Bacillus sp. 71mf]SFS36560.1 hypothetical protein SAMN04488145_10193 [Bacillus sp. 103mf]